VSDFNIDEDVYSYILENYNQEQADELLRSFELFVGFGLQYADSDILQIISRSQLNELDDIRDEVTQTIATKLHAIITEHRLSIDESTSLHDLNEIASGLLLIQHLSDYGSILQLLESDASDEDKFADVMASLTTLTALNVMDLVKEMDPSFIKNLTAFVSEKDKAINGHKFLPIDGRLLTRLRQFHEFIDQHSCMGIDLVKSGIPVGRPIEEYLPYLRFDIKTEDNIAQMALDLLSILMISSDGNALPLVAYKKISHDIFMNVDVAARIESIILKINTDFETELMARRQGGNSA
jgi:hypothetical protein